MRIDYIYFVHNPQKNHSYNLVLTKKSLYLFTVYFSQNVFVSKKFNLNTRSRTPVLNLGFKGMGNPLKNIKVKLGCEYLL